MPPQAGFSLIEVLVAVLVLGVGLLGLAALQITGLRLNDSALLRTRASLAAYDLADRLRAQPAAFLGGDRGDSVSVGADDCDAPAAAVDTVTRWQRAFCELSLPKPSSGSFASVDCGESNACGSENCAIVVRWSEARARQREGRTGAEDAELLFCTRLAAVR